MDSIIDTRRRRRLAASLVALLTSACSWGGSVVPISPAEGEPHGTLLLDFAERVGAGQLQTDGSHYDFAPDQAPDFLVQGWSAPENVPGAPLSFAWATELEASLELRVFDRESHWLHLRAQPAVSDQSRVQTVSVTVNDVDVGSVDLPPGGFTDHALRLPDSALHLGSNHVRFSFAYADSPTDHFPSAAETGPRAAAFDYVAITPSSEPPTARIPAVETLVLTVEEDRLVQPTGSEFAFRLTVPPDGEFEFGISAPMDAGEVQGEVSLRLAPDVEEVFFREPVTGDGTRWRADLSPLAGEDVDLVFRVVGGTFGETTATWHQPQLFGNPAPIDVTTNIVFIVIDTLRADHLGVYGGRADTPHLDALANSGVRFEHAYSHIPITVPSHSSMFTSLLPTQHAAFNNGNILGQHHLTLAEVLRQKTYRHTAGFVSLGVLKQQFGVAQGFTEYFDDFGADWWKTAGEVNADLLPWLDEGPRRPLFLWAHYSDPHEPYAAPGKQFPQFEARQDGTLLGTFAADGSTATMQPDLSDGVAQITLHAPTRLSRPIRINGLRTNADGVSVSCVEGCRETRPSANITELVTRLPATIRVENSGRVRRSATVRLRASERLPIDEARLRYREEVEYLDREIGRLLDSIRATFPPDDTLIILTADHGEELGEHSSPGHVTQLYDATLRVPFVFSWPGRLPAGRVVDDTVSHIDLLPTILDLLNVTDPEERAGRSLVRLLMGEPVADTDHPVIAETFRPEAAKDRQAVVANRYKLIVTPEDQVEELYNLDADPDEKHNILSEHPEIAADLRKALRAGLMRAQANASVPEESTLTEEQLERLRSLGYLR